MVASPEMDELAVTTLRSIPKNNTSDSENTAFLYVDENGKLAVTNIVNVPVTSGKTGKAEVTRPDNAIAVIHDHFTPSAPGPGAGDAMAIYKGLVNYVKDLNGNIYKIEFSKEWKTENNKQNGWKLTKLRGKRLKNQRRWVPGFVNTDYR